MPLGAPQNIPVAEEMFAPCRKETVLLLTEELLCPDMTIRKGNITFAFFKANIGFTGKK